MLGASPAARIATTTATIINVLTLYWKRAFFLEPLVGPRVCSINVHSVRNSIGLWIQNLKFGVLRRGENSLSNSFHRINLTVRNAN